MDYDDDQTDSYDDYDIDKRQSFLIKLVKDLKFFVALVIFVISIRAFIIEPFKIPSGSMSPTLRIGDFILVKKYYYGIRVPLTGLFEKGPIVFFGDNPKRGDVVVFDYPKNRKINYVKRIVGLPGDSIEVKSRELYINGKKIDEVPLKSTLKGLNEDAYKEKSFNFYTQEIKESKFHIQKDRENPYQSDYSKIIVPKDNFFVMGDNRDYSHDSRFWGFVPRKLIKGKAFLTWFSYYYEKGKFSIRSWRIGEKI